MDQFFLVTASSYYNRSLKTQAVTKRVLPKFQAEQNLTYQIESLQNEINKTPFAKAHSLVDKMLSCPRNSQTLILDGVGTGVLVSDFPQQLHRKNAEVRSVSLIFFDGAVIPPTLILNPNAKAKERGKWIPFKIKTSDATKIVHAVWWCFLVCVQFSENYQSTSTKGETVFSFKDFVRKIYFGFA